MEKKTQLLMTKAAVPTIASFLVACCGQRRRQQDVYDPRKHGRLGPRYYTSLIMRYLFLELEHQGRKLVAEIPGDGSWNELERELDKCEARQGNWLDDERMEAVEVGAGMIADFCNRFCEGGGWGRSEKSIVGNG
jgi:hypothetical protein